MRKVLGILLALLCAHCGGEGGAGDGGASYSLGLYTPSVDGGLAPMNMTTPFELRLGFQSFVFGRIAFELPSEAPELRNARVVLRIEGEAPARQNVSGLEYECRDCPRKRTPSILLFANDVSPRAVAGRPYELEATVYDERGTATARASGVLHWDPDCVEAVDGVCHPPDGGRD